MEGTSHGTCMCTEERRNHRRSNLNHLPSTSGIVGCIIFPKNCGLTPRLSGLRPCPTNGKPECADGEIHRSGDTQCTCATHRLEPLVRLDDQCLPHESYGRELATPAVGRHEAFGASMEFARPTEVGVEIPGDDAKQNPDTGLSVAGRSRRKRSRQRGLPSGREGPLRTDGARWQNVMTPGYEELAQVRPLPNDRAGVGGSTAAQPGTGAPYRCQPASSGRPARCLAVVPPTSSLPRLGSLLRTSPGTLATSKLHLQGTAGA